MRWLAVAVCCIATASAVIVDRIAITVGNKVITDSEIDLRIRLTAFENGDKPDFSAAARKLAADRLVDQKLVEREMEVGHYTELSGKARESLLTDYAKNVYRSDASALQRVLATDGITAADLEDDLARQTSLMNFLDLRFRPSVQVSDPDIRQYFDRQIKPNEGGQITLNDLRAEIEQRIIGQRTDAEMEKWLKEQRKGTRIVYLEKDLAP